MRISAKGRLGQSRSIVWRVEITPELSRYFCPWELSASPVSSSRLFSWSRKSELAKMSDISLRKPVFSTAFRLYVA